MEYKTLVTEENLDAALTKASDIYGIPKNQIRYNIRKDAKSGVFGIVPRRDIEIEILLPAEIAQEHLSYQEREASLSNRRLRQGTEEELIPFAELAPADRETALAIIQEVVVTIVATVSTGTSVQVYVEEGCVYVTIEESKDTKTLVGKELEVLKAIQYIIYKIVTQHVRCFFSLHISIGEYVVSEETLLMSMISKLIEKVKTTYKNQRTYPLNLTQRTLVQTMIENEPYVVLKKQKPNLLVQPVTLMYIGPKNSKS